MTNPIRILIADDHKVIQTGLGVFIAEFPDFMLAGRAYDGEEAVQAYRTLMPDVVLMDLMMPRLDGVAAIQAICREFPQARIIAMTSFIEMEWVRKALEAGAVAFVHKDLSADEFAHTIRRVNNGQPVLDAQALQALMAKAKTPSGTGAFPPSSVALSRQELAILKLLISGQSNREIGAKMGLTENTIKKYLSILYAKLGVDSRAEAVAVAIKKNLVKATGSL